mmetsp:Transcript_16750/g.41845  ORF Transcript_16750/g.41845 Transcript_16750/m.41845 type:complete len:237 (+) Transcript_16750:8514-9224(+)
MSVDVTTNLIVECDERFILSNSVGHRSHLCQQIIEGTTNLAHDCGCPGLILDGLEFLVGLAHCAPYLLEIVEFFDTLRNGIALGRVFQSESVLCPNEILLVGLRLSQTSFEFGQKIHGHFRCHVSTKWLVLAPGSNQIDRSLGCCLFFGRHSCLQKWELLFHGGDSTAQYLFHQIELSPDNSGFHPIVCKMKALALDETLGRLQLFKFGSPGSNVCLHFLNKGNAQDNVFRTTGRF